MRACASAWRGPRSGSSVAASAVAEATRPHRRPAEPTHTTWSLFENSDGKQKIKIIIFCFSPREVRRSEQVVPAPRTEPSSRFVPSRAVVLSALMSAKAETDRARDAYILDG